MGWLHRLHNVLRPDRLSRDLDRELQSHVAECAEELMAGGMSESDAFHEAKRRFGNPVRQKERTRDVDVLAGLDSVAADLRYAARSLVAAPALLVVAILSLGLGIGANTAIFSLINAVVLRSLPVSDPHELVQVTMGGGPRDAFTNPIWEELREHQQVFSGVFAFTPRAFNLAEGGVVRNTEGYWVSGGFFPTLGVMPVMGRLITASDDVRGCPAVAVVSDALWERELGGRRGLDGASIRLDGHRFEVVGVVDHRFTGLDVGQAVHVYAPLCTREIFDGQGVLDARSSWFLSIIGRPRAGTSITEVETQLRAMAPDIYRATTPPDFDAEHQRTYLSNTFGVSAAGHGLSEIRRQYSDALAVLMAVVGIVLLIACANVANLLLARATVRRHELAVRLAIGAGRWRIVRQLLTESLMLAFLGAATGVLFARWGSDLLVRLLDGQRGAVWLDLSLDWRVLLFTIAVTVVTALLFGLAPAWRAARIAPRAAMSSVGRGIAGGHSRFNPGKALLIGQVAMSFSLLVAAGLLLGTFRNIVNLDSGFVADGVLLVNADLQGTNVTGEGRGTLKESVLERLRGIPGVRSASASALTPISGSGWNGGITVEGYAPQNVRDAMVFYNAVSEGFLETFGTRLVAGRDFTSGDRIGSSRVAIINEAMSRKFFGAESPIGREFVEERPYGPRQAYTVIGLVTDAKYFSLREEPRPTAYLAITQAAMEDRRVSFALRTDDHPLALSAQVEREVAAVHPAISLELIPFAAQVDFSLSRERLLATLAVFFGVLALVLAVIGLYGTMSYAVARRRQEIGVRMALGAARSGVMRMILLEALWLIVLGVAAGFALAAMGARWLESFLFGVAPGDPGTIMLAALTLASVSFAAAAVPAWRAARNDPVIALRET